MTNTSYVFTLDGRRLVLRLPGRGAQGLVDRDNERAVYAALAQTGLTDEVVAFDRRGRRVTVFLEGARQANPADGSDLAVALGLARTLHQLELPLERRFGVGRLARRYQRAYAATSPAPYIDFGRQRARVAELLELRGRLAAPERHCHGDLNAQNVLILPDGSARLIDWEYSGRADPLLDVAQFCMHAFMARDGADLALRVYLGRHPAPAETARLYLHLALMGHLWALWSHLQLQRGVDLGDYGPRTYAYALEYYSLLAADGLVGRPLAGD